MRVKSWPNSRWVSRPGKLRAVVPDYVAFELDRQAQAVLPPCAPYPSGSPIRRTKSAKRGSDRHARVKASAFR